MLEFRQRAQSAPQGDWLDTILFSRGITGKEERECFLNPSLSQLHDPFRMEGMDAAAALIRETIRTGGAIAVWGDYDCDGVCASAIMLETLREMGARVTSYIPDRHREGYGLNREGIQKLAEGHQLILTVDCGVTNIAEVRYALALGLKVIVTDHHQLTEPPLNRQEGLEGVPVLNPLLGDYPFRRLCGAGVALKLTEALLGREAMERRLELAAIATVADLVPLTDENRVIVREGLARLSATRRPGLRAMYALANIQPPLTSTDLGYRIGPRINAGGRLEDAAQCVRFLMTQDEEEGAALARHLEDSNAQRQALQTEITAAAEAELRRSVDYYEDLALIAAGEGWNSGIIGLAAGRICERAHFPVIVLSVSGETAVGSCRSIPGVNIHRMLVTCDERHRAETGEPLFIRFGGHEQAAGLTLRTELIPVLRRRLNEAIRAACDLSCYIPVLEYDCPLRLGEVNLELVEALSRMEPTGFGNPAPVFLVREAQVQTARRVGRDSRHLKLTLLDGAEVRDGIGFGLGALAESSLSRVDALFVPERNEFMGRVSAELQVSAMKPSAGCAALPPAEALFPAFLQELTHLTANIDQILPEPAEGLTLARLKPLCAAGRGVLMIGHERERAARAALETGADTAVGRLGDARAFNTVLLHPDLNALRDAWHAVVLLDGDLLPGELAALRAACPRARLYMMSDNPRFTALLDSLALPDEPLRALYRAVAASQRPGQLCSAGGLGGASGLTAEQTLFGLKAFEQVGLVSLDLEPFRLRLLPARKCSMEESSLIRFARGRLKR
ncbi:MAG: single-stranded-DNA-specific exonuclease RecJ [Clostridia bacterium]|nr:single-stranded-DNA-specific exonuclease RecJ [Clostridia bacterium]